MEMMKLEVWTLVPTAITGRKQFLIERFLVSGREKYMNLSEARSNSVPRGWSLKDKQEIVVCALLLKGNGRTRK